jgi:hypothetical protein
MENNLFGFKVSGSTSNASVNNSVAAGNSAAGFSAAVSGAILTIERSVSTHNSTGVTCVAGSTVRIGNTSLSDNSGGDVAGTCSSYKNNDIDTVVVLTGINPQ